MDDPEKQPANQHPERGGGVAAKSGVTINEPRTGRFAPTDALTQKQEDFVRHFVANGGNATRAAESAGYAFGNAGAYKLVRNPAVKMAISAAVSERLESGTVLAWGVLEELMRDPNTPAPVRLGAAKWTLEAAGHGLAAEAVRARIGGTESKSLSEMSLDEIEAHVRRTQASVDALRAAEGRVIETETTDGARQGE